MQSVFLHLTLLSGYLTADTVLQSKKKKNAAGAIDTRTVQDTGSLRMHNVQNHSRGKAKKTLKEVRRREMSS